MIDPQAELDTRATFIMRLAQVVNASAFKPPKAWKIAVAIFRRTEQWVTSRVDLAHWFRANALPALEHDCKHRRVGEGEILVYVDVDGESDATTGLIVVPLVAELQRVVSGGGQA